MSLDGDLDIIPQDGHARWYADTDDVCCRDRLVGLRLLGDRIRCGAHAQPEDVRLVDELDRRGAAIGVPRAKGIAWWGRSLAWPYGPNVDVEMRARMLEWAEAHRLTYVDRPHRCLAWLRASACRSSRCRVAPHRAWMDHVTCWARGGKPRVLVAQPYVLTPADTLELGVLGREPGLRVELRAEGGWYGFGTWFVGVWKGRR